MAYEAVDTASLVEHYAAVRKRFRFLKPHVQSVSEPVRPEPAVEVVAPATVPVGLPPFVTKYPKHSEIIQHVCKFFDVTTTDLLSDRRTQNLVLPRHIAAYLMKELTLSSLPVIGKRLGRRDHTTIMHALRKIRDRIASDESFAATVGLLRQQIMARLEKRNAAVLPPEDTSVIVQ